MLDELKRLLGEATPGPWGAGGETVQDYDCGGVAMCWLTHEGDGKDRSEANARLIAAAVNALPKLLAVAEAAKAAHAAWLAADRDSSELPAMSTLAHELADALGTGAPR